MISTKNATSILELFHNVDIENREITKPLIAEYNLKLNNCTHSSSSINIPVNLESLIKQQTSDRFCKNKVKR